ncbi:cysteine--tRNA ligase [Microgenomates group bacterium RIFCSPLOWO2_01_FULL_47_10]|nr:MAG: cysteine--tRNA ligase [Microgenomates group bacterium RIFCSPLOWO2_01_FULL_47_10]
MKFFNSLTKQLEEFVPIDKAGTRVGIYTCGPTVYDYPHIGNWRTFVLGDLVVRSLIHFGYHPHYLMNITDVGHLTGDNLGDASSGEDRLEKGAKREGKTAWEVAAYYTKDFLLGYEKLNLTWPKDTFFCKATDHIAEQIAMIQKIEDKGFVYRIADGVYFDVGAYEKAGNTYGLMSALHLDEGVARIAENKEKKDTRDFALWKLSPAGEKRQMEWESPWGVGFPGWHIECSAMSTKYLGEQFDIHIGGEDHKSTHHPNEIAQTESATGKKPFVAYWLHGAFLQVDGGRMGKSLGNTYTLADVEGRGFDPLDLRYFYMTGHYRKVLNFTFTGLQAAQNARMKLQRLVGELEKEMETENKQEGQTDKSAVKSHQENFSNAIANDLNIPQALGVLWEVVGDEVLGRGEKRALITAFDMVLGLGLTQPLLVEKIPKDILELAQKRTKLRDLQDWAGADGLRDQLLSKGYTVEDGGHDPIIKRK